MNISAHMGMDLFNVVNNSPDNYNEVKDCTLTYNKPFFREISMFSTVLLVAYHDRITINNDNDGNAIMEPINIPQLLYVIPEGQNNQVSMVADPNNNMINQYVLIKGLAPNNSKLWNSNFHPVLLHGSLEHLASDAENITKLMVYMATEIKNKKIETSKSNNIKNFEDIEKVT